MAIRTALLNWNNITRDTDFSKYIESVSEPWVIEWLQVSASEVAVWKARVLCERTGGETIYSLVTVTSAQSISGNGDVYIEVAQEYIDNWELANEDWTGIATINVWTMPSKNALKLAEKDWSTVVDARNMIKKVWELNTFIQSLESRMTQAEEDIQWLQEAGAIDHLEESWLVWELYTLSDTLFKQNTPKLADSTLDANIGDVDNNKQVHIQRIGSWEASNKLKLKVKSVWAPTTWLVVEVRTWVQVTVTDDVEAYWYGDELICSWSIDSWSITNDYAEIEVTMDGSFWGTKGELLDVVVYQTNNTINASNYYCVACDSTQYSEWFSYVSVNSSTRTRSKLMPYCIADGFAQSLLCKANKTTQTLEIWPYGQYTYNTGYTNIASWTFTDAGTVRFTGKLYINDPSLGSNDYAWLKITVNWVSKEVSAHTLYNSPYLFTIDFWYTSGSYSIAIKTSSSNKMAQCADVYGYQDIGIFTINVIPLLPTEVVNIWEVEYATLYGNHTDGKYYWGLVVGTDTSATTGSITLGNAVGYLKVNYNWNIVKIPYYN